jgi:DNA-binding NarL/FixJ family response regulator
MTPFSVLLVDDQPSVLHVLTLLVTADDRLTVAGTADNGLSAVTAAQQHRPAAIVCDVQMPVMDGLQALPLLREACPDSVIIMYSSDMDAAWRAMKEGADAVYNKSHDASLLLDRVVELCLRRR